MSSEKYMELLSREYPTKQHVCREIINLNAILNLPKGTEHFMSDIHGEYEAFIHLLRSASGMIREKIDETFDYLTSVGDYDFIIEIKNSGDMGREACRILAVDKVVESIVV